MTQTKPAIRAHRPLVMGRNGAVAANHPVAAQAGLGVLQAGGNAVDAALAIALTLGVVEPHMSGLGGDGFYHVYLAASGRSVVYNGTGAAALAATVAHYRTRFDGIPAHGPASISTPGLLAGLAAMHKAHGAQTWASLFRPAIAAAAGGFAATHAHRHFTGDNVQRLKPDARSRHVFLRRDAAAPEVGDLIIQPDLAATLEAIGRDGAETFYRGPLARRIAAGLATAGALVGADDLARCEAERQDAIAIDYRGYEVRQTGLNSMGFTLLQELKIAECYDLAKFGWGAADLVHILVEVKKRAFLDRERFACDPRWQTAPLDRLLSAEHAAAHVAEIDMARAAHLPVHLREASGDTTYFCVVDAAGNAVSAIQSLNSAFGSGITAGDTGIVMNNRMAYWHLDAGHPNLLAPGKRVRHTMNAPLVLKNGKLWCVTGTPGADKQVQVNLQSLVGMIDFGLDPQAVLESPRWVSNQPGDDANYPHTSEDSLTLERGFGDTVIAELARRGHTLKIVGDFEAPCSVETIRILDNGVRMAGSDPRRDGWAAAY